MNFDQQLTIIKDCVIFLSEHKISSKEILTKREVEEILLIGAKLETYFKLAREVYDNFDFMELTIRSELRKTNNLLELFDELTIAEPLKYVSRKILSTKNGSSFLSRISFYFEEFSEKSKFDEIFKNFNYAPEETNLLETVNLFKVLRLESEEILEIIYIKSEGDFARKASCVESLFKLNSDQIKMSHILDLISIQSNNICLLILRSLLEKLKITNSLNYFNVWSNLFNLIYDKNLIKLFYNSLQINQFYQTLKLIIQKYFNELKCFDLNIYTVKFSTVNILFTKFEFDQICYLCYVLSSVQSPVQNKFLSEILQNHEIVNVNLFNCISNKILSFQ